MSEHTSSDDLEYHEPSEDFIREWLNRVASDRCWNCAHFVAMGAGGVAGSLAGEDILEMDGFCHRFPPVLGHPRINAGGRYDWWHPVVAYHDHCGEFKSATRQARDFL